MPWLGRGEVPYKGHSLKGATAEVRGLSVQHLNDHDPERPYVYLCAVQLPGYHLGCHPIGSTHKGFPVVALTCDSGTETEVGEFDLQGSERKISLLQ